MGSPSPVCAILFQATDEDSPPNNLITYSIVNASAFGSYFDISVYEGYGGTSGGWAENPVGERVGRIRTVTTPSGCGGILPLPYFSGSCQVPVARKGYSRRSYLPKVASRLTPARPCCGSEAHSQPCRYSWKPEVTGVDEGGRLDGLSSGQVGVAVSQPS